MLIRMAWRNLWRRKRRTLITCMTVAIGLWVASTTLGIHDYSDLKMVNTSASMGFGHVSVEPLGYLNKPGFDKSFRAGVEMTAAILATPGVKGASPKIIGPGMIGTASKTVGGMLMGVDPAAEKPERNVFIRAIIEGSPFTASGASEVVIGRRLAERLNLKIGKKLVYTATDAKGEIVSDIARVRAIFKTGDENVDGGTILLPIGKLRGTLHFGPDDATVVSVHVGDERDADGVAADLKVRVGAPGVEVRTWRDTQPDLAGTIAMDKSFHRLFNTFIWLLVATGILDAMLMSVLERKHEMGLMMAVGTSPRTLFLLVLAESFLTAIVGLGIAIVMNLPWYWFMTTKGIDLSAMVPEGYGVSGVVVDPVIRMVLFKESVVRIVVTFFSLTLVAGLYPAFKAARVPPVETMKIV
ncbi:MAG: ABC transporter permease [Nitrospinae bacterium]|nr:ABC transporter permease [Nitrospinota bacterium]